jgi:NTE family protein
LSKFFPRDTSNFAEIVRQSGASTSVLFRQDARSIGKPARFFHPRGMQQSASSPMGWCDTPSTVPSARPGIGLALGGGFARGFAHLGILQVFEEQHIPISHIAGTSVGSILGAAYASGAPLARIMDTCSTLRLRDIARWRVSRLGLASNYCLGDLIERVFESRHFEDLRIPMSVVTTDLASGEPVVFTHGPLVEVIRASCAFPGLFEPVEIGTRFLADGGLVAPVPTVAARAMAATIPTMQGATNIVVGVSVGMHDGYRGAPTNIFQVVSRAVSAAQKHQAEIWERDADLVLRPEVQSLAWDDFDRTAEAIDAGAAAARRAVPRIRQLLDKAAAANASAPAPLFRRDFWAAELAAQVPTEVKSDVPVEVAQ